MTVPSVDADFGRLLNAAPRVADWARRDVNGRRGGTVPDLAGPGPGRPDQPSPLRQVLFISGPGIARSWMAATLLAHYGGHYAQAGFDGPTLGAVPLTVATAMREINLTARKPAIPGPALLGPPDLLITMGCADIVPADEHIRVRSWNIPDPEGQPIDAVRAVRDAIAQRVRLLTEELRAAQ